MIVYKCELKGISVIPHEEAHTSKCSFLDSETVEHHEKYVGKRIKRGLFKTAKGRTINADVNAGYNMIVKVVPNAFGNGIEGVGVHPVDIISMK